MTTFFNLTRPALFLVTGIFLTLTPALAHHEETDDWVARSDANAQLFLDVIAEINPEFATLLGITGSDEEVIQLAPDRDERFIKATEEVLGQLHQRRAEEAHPAVLQDLDILIDSAEREIARTRLEEKYLLPYFDVPQDVFRGIRSLLDDQMDAERRPAALVRLRRYAGLEEGFTPLAVQAAAFTRARFGDPGLIGPYIGETEKNLSNSQRFIDGIGQLFQKYEIEGWEEAHAALGEQLGAYDEFVRKELQPRARQDFRLPEEVYSSNLSEVGVDMPVGELVSRAKVAFREIQNEMQAIAALVAAERGLESSDYRDVIRALKKEQLVGEAILPHYQQRIKDLEKIIAREEIVTLPEREMRFRLASEAESAAVPAPHMRPPRMIGNTGEMGEFVLPLKIPGEDGEDLEVDDFNFDAASWTLTVHEGRPGHEMQFASIVEKGVSTARALFAFNSVNVEGWALYSEAELKPYLPLDGQLISLQHRLLRSARAFLDPGLQLGELSEEEAFKVLEEDVVLSHAMATEEVQRYTFWAPAQATAYFCGYTRLIELRTDAERLLDDAFDRKAYHDFILAQGLLPPKLLRGAVLEGFVKPQLEADSSE